jgi:cell division septum initiation protein DivIVA
MGGRPVTVIIFIFTAILVPVLVGECVDWLPWAGTRLIRLAANRLPLQYRARYEEEWQAEFNVLPGGKLTKLLFGLRIYANARATGALLRAEDNMDLVARVLSLAQQTADQAIADARRECDEILTKARRQAEQITGDARARAESLERDAQERHRQAMGSLVQTREELERRVDDLRAFEREYRSRLKAYLEGQLRDLEAGVTDSGTFPTMGSGSQPSMPPALAPSGARNGGQGTGQYGVPEVVPHSGGFRTSDGAPSRERR